jgi:hypothetical protein
MQTEHFTEREVSTLLRPRRSGATWENGLPHSGSLDFADTEEVTGSNPVAPTTILAGHSVAGVDPIALTTCLGRAGAARHPRRRARLILPGPSTRSSGPATTTHRSRGRRAQMAGPHGAVRQPRASANSPAPAQSPATGRPRGGLASWSVSAAASSPSTTRPVRGRRFPAGLHTTSAAVPASMAPRAVCRPSRWGGAAGEGAGPHRTRGDPAVTAARRTELSPIATTQLTRDETATTGRTGGHQTAGHQPSGRPRPEQGAREPTLDGLDAGRRDTWTPDGGPG